MDSKPEIHTQVDIKFFNCRANITQSISDSYEKYVYLIDVDSKKYIIKGQRYPIDIINPHEPKSQQFLIDLIQEISRFNREYDFAKITCAFSQHFAKPLFSDFLLENDKNEIMPSILYYELLFEYAGIPISKLDIKNIKEYYNLMKQSANALNLLHIIGVTHLDIKPDNMVYDKENDLLKIIDMGSSNVQGSLTKIYSTTVKLGGKMHSYTPVYSPPEIIQETLKENNKKLEFVMGGVDSYCWAMCFYTIIAKRKIAELDMEIQKFKRTNEDQYNEFLEIVRKSLSEYPTNNEEEEKIKQIIILQIINALNYTPSKRPKMKEILLEFENFEKRNLIKIPYSAKQEEFKEKIKDSLLISENNKNTNELRNVQQKEETKKTEINLPAKNYLSKLKSKECFDCSENKNIKVILECSHKICLNCCKSQVLKSIKSGNHYHYNIFCQICSQYIKIRILYYFLY